MNKTGFTKVLMIMPRRELCFLMIGIKVKYISLLTSFKWWQAVNTKQATVKKNSQYTLQF
ncbi:MAG: hypothetical protein WBO44_12905 [Saprospiraceae bacterium]